MKLDKLYWIVAAGLIMLTAYQFISSRQNLLNTALNMAEENREELEKTLDHYNKVDKDKEKLQAAEFLISNCIIHGSVNYTIADLTGKIIDYNPSNYPDYKAAREAKASISSRAKISSETVFDIKSLKSDYLINHIDYGICVMRSLGIPVSSDFDIHGRTNLGHTWCVVFDENGKSYSFGAGEDQPGEHIHTFSEYKHRTLAKVFRNSFKITNTGLVDKVKDPNEIPPFFRSRNTSDVTPEYVETIDVEYSLSSNFSKDNPYLYLCVYNNSEWKPLQWSEVKRNNAVFPAMGPDILYIVGDYSNGYINPVSSPFALKADGSKSIFSNAGEKLSREYIYDRKIYYEYPLKSSEYVLDSWNDGNWETDQCLNSNPIGQIDLRIKIWLLISVNIMLQQFYSIYLSIA